MKLFKTLRPSFRTGLAAALALYMAVPAPVFAQPANLSEPQAEPASRLSEAEAFSQSEDEEALGEEFDALPREELSDHLEGYTVYTDTVSYAGQKLKGIFIKYDDNVQASTLRTSTYDVQAYKGDNKTLASADITAVYTNSECSFREDKTSVEGPYVVIEISEYDGVGTMDLSNIYVTDEDGKEYSTGGYGNISAIEPVVTQKSQIALSDVLVKSGVLDKEKLEATVNNNFDEFVFSSMPSDYNNYGDGLIRYQYHLPENYDENGSYPLVVVQCGGGLRLRELKNDDGEIIYRSEGANIIFDTSVTSWMDDEFMSKDYYEDVIVLSVNNRCINDVTDDPYNRYVAADDINQVTEYFINNFAVDPSRVYYSGNSQGSLIGYQTVSSRPDIWTAFMPCNGLALTSPDPFTSDENMAAFMKGVAKVMDPITDNHIAVRWNLGETDFAASAARGQLFYDYAKEKYEAEGMTQDEIDSILSLNIFADEEYLHYGITNADGSAYAHGATKLAYTAHKDEFQPWILGQKKEKSVHEASSIAKDAWRIQALAGPTIYGEGVFDISVAFKSDVDISKLTEEDFVLTDRGSLSPEYGQVPIKSILVDSGTNTVRIAVDTSRTAATETNAKVYTNPGATGSRSRNAFGIYCTGAWYRDVDGTIHYGKEDTDEYKANTTGQGYQVRESLELRLRLAGEEGYDDSECLANELGGYNAGSLWLPVYNVMRSPEHFQNLYDLQIPSTGADIPDGTADPYVRGYYYVPEDYNPSDGIVVYLQGQGISYWQDQDGTNNEGCGFLYDTNTWAWKDSGAIVVNIQDRSTAGFGLGEVESAYDFVVDDANVMKYFIDKYDITGNIIVQGNSRGTMAADILIKALAGASYNPAQQGAGFFANEENGGYYKTLDKDYYDFEINTYVCQNGPFGGHSGDGDDMFQNDSVWETVARTGLRVWCFDGEQDMHENIPNIAKYKEVCKAVGHSDEWIKDNVRLTGYTTELFYPWGETDHSVTRINGWYFANQPYYGPDLHIDPETGEIVYDTRLADGDEYELVGYGRAATNAKHGYKYTVYDDTYVDWALRPTDFGLGTIADDVESFQAVTDMTFYGQGLSKLVINFKPGIDVSRMKADDFVVEDRGSLNPDFGKIKFSGIQIEGQKVTLTASTDTAATENNSRIYSGSSKEGNRERNAFGIYCTGAWYRGTDGTIYYGNDFTDAYQNNTTGLGYQTRESLELRIRYSDEIGFAPEAKLAKADGSYNADGLWLETQDNYFGDGRIVTFEEAGINVPSTSAAATDGTGDEYVKGFIYVPENYDALESVPVVFTEQGQGIVYWKLPDGTNNFGTSAMYDATMTSWIGKGVIVVHIEDRSTTGTGLSEQLKNCYDFVADDVAVMKAVFDKYDKADPEKIILHGNSRGTNASNFIILALSGCEYKLPWGGTAKLDKNVYDFEVDTYLCHNGDFGRGFMGIVWDDESIKDVAATGLRAWIFDGQQDTDNVERRELYVAALKEAGYPDSWIEENVRLTGYPTQLYYHWGESDHSTTRINHWYFADEPFWGPDVEVAEDGSLVYRTKLNKGDTYQLVSADMGSNAGGPKDGYSYKIYGDPVQPWALKDAEDNTSRAKVADYVSKLYKNFLGRDADEKGLASWTDSLIEGRATLAKVVYGFVYSQEFQMNPLSNKEYVTALYRTVMNREPDSNGLSSWVNILENGCTRKIVLGGFLNSEEMKLIAADLGVEPGYYKSNELVDQNYMKTMFVVRLYKVIFGRTASKNELESWLRILNSDRYSVAGVIRGFFKSDENRARGLSSEEQVKLIYQAVMNREADEEGLANWVSAFNRYGSAYVINGLAGSQEFKELLRTYGFETE